MGKESLFKQGGRKMFDEAIRKMTMAIETLADRVDNGVTAGDALQISSAIQNAAYTIACLKQCEKESNKK